MVDYQSNLRLESNKSDYEKAVEFALQKLSFIIEREGDANGERLKDYYINNLVEDQLKKMVISKQGYNYLSGKKDKKSA